MIDSDKARFATLIYAAGTMFGTQVEKPLIAMYWQVISPVMSIEEFEAAMAKHIATGRFFPKPVDLTGAEDFEHAALEAWEIANRAMAAMGSYRAVNFHDPAINATIRSLGGWIEFGQLNSRTEKFYRADFLKVFQAFKRNGVSEEAGAALIGLGEATHVKRDAKGRVTDTKNEPAQIAPPTTPTRKRIG